MIVIGPTKDRATCYALRHEVFVVEQGYSAEGEVDALDDVAHHIIALDGETPVATARVVMDGQTAKIGRVCVLRALRGKGLGADLVRAAVDHARTLDAARIVLGSQAYAVPFYAKLGFSPFGDLYEDEGEPHQMMERAP